MNSDIVDSQNEYELKVEHEELEPRYQEMLFKAYRRLEAELQKQQAIKKETQS